MEPHLAQESRPSLGLTTADSGSLTFSLASYCSSVSLFTGTSEKQVLTAKPNGQGTRRHRRSLICTQPFADPFRTYLGAENALLLLLRVESSTSNYHQASSSRRASRGPTFARCSFRPLASELQRCGGQTLLNLFREIGLLFARKRSWEELWGGRR